LTTVVQSELAYITYEGNAILRLRISEVSKNHQKQAFRFKICPDVSVSPEFNDIAPCISTSVTVLSKRNRKRKSVSDAPAMRPVVKKAIHLANLHAQNPAGPQVLPVPQPLLPLAVTDVHSSSEDQSSARKDSPIRSSPLQRIPKSPTRVGHTPDSTKAFENLLASASKEDGLTIVLHWFEFVVEIMRNLEWQTVGYEIGEDGNPVASHPILRCPACWCYRDVARGGNHSPICMVCVAHCLARKATNYSFRFLKELSSTNS
jgi:hypothetical protein